MSRNRRTKSHAQSNHEPMLVSEVHEEPVIDDETAFSEESVLGIVHNCLTLNIREEPEKDAGVVCSISCLTEVMVDENESTDEFYKICTASGIEGYCMKKYISVHP